MNMITLAAREDRGEILALYRSLLYGPADWNEYYPNEDTIDFDMSRNALFVMKNDLGEIIAAISIDEDEEVDRLPCWSIAPAAELSRLCVRKDMHNRGIAKQMMRYAFDAVRKEGKNGVHILVRPGHTVALSAYGKLGFQSVGKCHLFDMDFVCMEIKL